MRNKRLWSILLVLSLMFHAFLSVSSISEAAAMEGAGTQKSPYLIKTVEDLYSIPQNPKADYKLMNDLDLENVERAPMPDFKGVLDGNNKAIINLNVTGTVYVGLFERILNSTVKNLAFIDSKINATKVYSGTLCAYASYSTISNVAVTNGIVNGNYAYVGGLIGFLDNSNVLQCSATGDVIGNEGSCVGGLIGVGQYSKVSQCFAEANVSGESEVGGLIGANMIETSFTINNCYSRSKIKATRYYGFGAGIIKSHNANLVDCYSICQIEAPLIYGLTVKGVVKNSYFNDEILNITTPEEQARTTEQMYQKSNYEGWDFEKVWYIDEGKDYPRLRFELEMNR